MNKIKKYITMAVAGAMLVSFTGCNIIERTPESIGKTVLAKVEGEKITRADLDKVLTYQLNSYKTQYGEDFENNEEVKTTLKDTRKQALDGLISEKVLLSKAGDLGLEFNDDEVKTEADKQIASFKQSSGSDEAYLELIQQYGYSEDEFMEYCKKQYKLSKIAEEITKDITTTDEELQAYYDTNIASFKVNAGAEVIHLLFTDATKGEAQAKAARELVVGGKSFDDVKAMDEYKDDATVMSQPLGHQDFEGSQLDPLFVTGFKDLAVDEISQPVKSNSGWHLIKNTKINKEEVTQTFDEVKETVKATVLQTNQNAEVKSKIEEYKGGMDVKIYEDRY